ncbi:hypothetical protein AJ78_00118 [Emergomyces pasteurianus Ep9510]|uniref:Rrn9 domain-containing protein n=1 Tax=Emergomyces pasteurianus Ep9510 TaxID=1447872 RepID=A0A1J9QVN8_9EURO|nr:hypothetical protein AJ78_00118 [Emergomyces pasteurianus Ep9510]
MSRIAVRTRNPSVQAAPEVPSSTPDPDILEHDGNIIASHYFPQPDASYDGTYNTENGDLSDSNNLNAHEETRHTLEEGDYNSSGDSPILDRPNRYLGPPSTWRAKTRQERHEISSLDALRARDLSSHLFNAFALKRRAIAIKSQTSDKGQEQQSNIESDADPSSQFVPTKQWTAWPLPADEVPRGDAHVPIDDTDIWNISAPSDGRPSAELEECLIAQMLKTAKERFESRAWDRQPVDRNRTKRTTYRTDTGVISTGAEESDEDIDIQPALQFRPVIQADDEKSRSILRPTARHILSDFDNILMSLHHSRQAYVSTIDLSQSEYETDPEEVLASRSVSKSRTSSSRHMSRPRGINPSRNSSITRDPRIISDKEGNVELPDAPNPHSRSRSLKPQRTRSNTPRRSRSRSPGSRQSKLGLREWADIVGIASISGWPTSVVLRTAKRCSELFGEDMAFRTLNEGKLELKEGNGNCMPTWEYVEGEESGESNTDAEIAKPSKVAQRRGRDHTGVIYCPVQRCSRSTKGFSRTWNLNQHIKNRHPGLELRGSRSKSTLPYEESS